MPFESSSPIRFESAEVEREFQREFRELGFPSLRWALLCALLAAAAFIAIRGSPPYLEEWFSIPQVSRGLALVALAGSWIAINWFPRAALANYSLYVVGPILLALVSLAVVVGIGDPRDPLVQTRMLGAIALGCWLVFGYARLPFWASITGCSIPCVGLATNLQMPTDSQVAISIYMALYLFVGALSAQAIERIERMRFQQRRQIVELSRDLRLRTVEAERGGARRARQIAFVGHDMRQPIASLGLQIGQLKSRLVTNASVETLELVDGIEACQRVLAGELDRLFLRDPFAFHESESYQCDVDRLLVRLRSVYWPVAQKAGCRMRVRLCRGSSPVAASDDDLLWVVLSNLVTNAIKFSTTPEQIRPPVVVVSAVNLRHLVRFDVRDNGVGIPADDLPAIFDEGWTTSRESKGVWSGQGLGLAIASEALSRLPEHRLAVSSVAGVGTRFRVYAPLLPVNSRVQRGS